MYGLHDGCEWTPKCQDLYHSRRRWDADSHAKGEGGIALVTKQVDIAIVGAGPAGLAAAIEASSLGARVSVIDENIKAGGQLFKQIHKFFGSHRHFAGVRGVDIGEKLLEDAKRQGVDFHLQTSVIGVFDGPTLALNHANESSSAIRARKVLFATGASENALPFEGWTLPGVMGAGAMQTLINLYRVLPARRVLMVGSGNVGLIVSYQLLQAGSDVAGIVEVLPEISGYLVHAAKIRRAGVPFFTEHVVKRVHGDGKVERAVLAPLSDPMNEKEIAVDVICLATGLTPGIELPKMAGCRIVNMKDLGGYVPWHDERMRTSLEDFYVAGDVGGIEEASTAMEKGRVAAISMTEDLGLISQFEAATRREVCSSALDDLRQGPFGEKRSRAFCKLQNGDDSKVCQREVRGAKFPPSLPDISRFEKGPAVIIDCPQAIACNPCETACPAGAIEVGADITAFPVVDYDRCTGCGICVAKCPGLAIRVVDLSKEDKAVVTFPHEYLPYPEVGELVRVADANGNDIGMGPIAKLSGPIDRTMIVSVSVPHEIALRVRGLFKPAEAGWALGKRGGE